MQIELLDDQGQAASQFDAPETVFGRTYNEDLVHQIVVAYQANARQGTRGAERPRAGSSLDEKAVQAKGHRPLRVPV